MQNWTVIFFEDFQKALHLLGKVMEIGNDTET